MNRSLLAFATCAAFACAIGIARPQATPQPYASPTPVPNQYNDPAMSFTAPPDFYQIPMAPHDPAAFDQSTVVAAWVKNPGQRDQLTISITMENHDGTLDGFEMVTENELRDKSDGVFFKKKEQTKLSNGMPAYWQEISLGSGFDELKRFQYVWVDSVRGVALAVTGRYGRIDEPTAKKVLAQASGVLFPRRR